MADFIISNTGEQSLRRYLDRFINRGHVYTLTLIDIITDTYRLTVDGLKPSEETALQSYLDRYTASFTIIDSRDRNDRLVQMVQDDTVWNSLTDSNKINLLRYFLKNVI